MMTKEEQEKLKKELDQDGLARVKEKRVMPGYGNAQQQNSFVDNWIREKERESEIQYKEETLSIARRAQWISIFALIVSICVAIFK